MGYTHYWHVRRDVQQDKLDKTIKDIQKVVKKAKKDGLITGWDGEVNTEITNDKEKIAFNGIGEGSHETFEVQKSVEAYKTMKGYEEPWTFEFCKTARKGYDIVVVACLSAMKKNLGQYIEVTSDGDMEPGGDWARGREYLYSILEKEEL